MWIIRRNDSMAISTTRGHVSRAVAFFKEPEIFFGFGRQTPWSETGEDEAEIPEAPSMAATEVEEPIGFKLVDRVHLVIPNEEDGTIAYKDSKWEIVSEDQAYNKNSRHVYIECTLRYDEIPLIDYRQIGILTGLKRETEVSPGKAALIPSEVADQGILQILDNRKPTVRQKDQKEQLSLIIEF